MARTKYTPPQDINAASGVTPPHLRGPSDHELRMNALRSEYTRLYGIFTKNNLDPGPFARRLYGERDIDNIRQGVAAMRDFLIANHCLDDDPMVRQVDEDNRPEYEHASRESAEDWLSATPERAPTQPARPTPTQRPNMQVGCDPVEGKFYMVGNRAFHVVKGRNGHLYARSRNKSGQWEYQKGAIFAVRDNGRQATVEDIAAYGLASGRCFVCGKPLADPESVKRGIGPVCIKRVQG